MPIDDSGVIDILGRDYHSGNLFLTVADHLDWSNSVEHQELLQAKLNAYLAYIESGEILKKYPDAQTRRIVIKVAAKYEPDSAGLKFLERAKAVIENAGFEFRFEVLRLDEGGPLPC